MFAELAILQFSLMFLFAFLCSAALLIIFSRTRPSTIYRTQPSLAVLLFTNFASAASIMPFAALWIFFALESLVMKPIRRPGTSVTRRCSDRSIENEAILVISGIVSCNFNIVYDCVTTGVFLQRNCFLAFPLHSARHAKKVVVWIVAVAIVTEVVLLTIANMASLGYQKELKKECFSFNCILLPKSIARLCNLTVKCVSSVVNVTLGITFIVLLKKRKFHVTRPCERKVNRFLMYTFIWRTIFETAPFFLDLFSTLVLRVNLGVYVGAYGAQEWSLDICSISISYYFILVKKPTSDLFQSTNAN